MPHGWPRGGANERSPWHEADYNNEDNKAPQYGLLEADSFFMLLKILSYKAHSTSAALPLNTCGHPNTQLGNVAEFK